MSSNPKYSVFRSLSFRLSLTYAACCLVSMTAVLVVCYLFLEGSLRRHTDTYLAQEVPEYRLLLASQNAVILADTLEKEAFSEGTDKVFFRVLDQAGQVKFGTDTSSWRQLAVDQTALHAALGGKIVFADYRDELKEFSARVVYGMIGENLVLQLGESLDGNQHILSQFRQVFAAATLAFVFCSLLAGTYMAQRALAGVQRVTQTAVYITAGAWNHRVPVSRNHDEIDELASAFNTMVDRIEVLFKELRDVTDDIAHDLRTPLMRIRGEAEMALGATGVTDVDLAHCGSVLEECDIMLHLINTMLEISQTEAGAKPLEREPTSLGEIVEDVCDLFRPAAEDKGIVLDCTAGNLPDLSGEAQRLQRALAHLVDNAIKYTPEGGHISVVCTQDGDTITTKIRDTGIGIAAESQDDVFARFYRVEPSRNDIGNGLGLSLARAIIRAHEGDIQIESVVGRGTTFIVTLPVGNGTT